MFPVGIHEFSPLALFPKNNASSFSSNYSGLVLNSFSRGFAYDNIKVHY